MKKRLSFFFMTVVASLFIFTACGADEDVSNGVDEGGDELVITTSFSVLSDIVGQIVGERGTVDYIVPIGEEPEEHEPVPSDFEKVTDADVFFINGLGLESWLTTLMDNVTDTPAVEVGKGFETIPLSSGNADDPHAWLDPKLVEKYYVDNIVDYLVEIDPEGESYYKENAESYKQELAELDAWIQEEIEQIPEEHRFIAISEDAFVYFGAAYGFETEGIWELNSHEEGTPQQISRMIDIISERDVPAVFKENSVNPTHMESVSNDAGVPIAGVVYTDSLGEEGSGIYTYIDMMKESVNTFVEGLGQNN